jgi:hypothetical protein
MYKFCIVMVGKFRKGYLRGPNEAQTSKIMAQHVAREIFGMLENIDCIQGHHGKCNVVLEAMADHDIVDLAFF